MAYRKEPIAIAVSPSKLWDVLSRPRDVLRKIPSSRFNVTSIRHSYTLSEDHEVFDANFPGARALEACSINPQQRIFLERAYEAPEGMPSYFASGTSRSVTSNRISYVFDLHGPSMTIDTACSSSLVALHQAVSIF
ncbi:Thiolase-like protein [Rhypophila decipiens]